MEATERTDSTLVTDSEKTREEIELEDYPLKINVHDGENQVDTAKYLCTLFPRFEITDKLEDTDLYWIYKPVQNIHFKMLKDYKFFMNRYHGAEETFNKSIQAEVYNLCKKHYPDDYKFWPDTYILPRDREIAIKMIKEKEGTGQAWVYKLSMTNGGSGATIFNTFDEFNMLNEREHAVLQSYIGNPLIINKKKFDCRIYVVVAGVNPMRAYLSPDFGLTKCCAQDYSLDYTNNS